MATAQQLFIEEFIRQINAEPNISPLVTATSSHPGFLTVTARGAETPTLTYDAAGSSVSGAGSFAVKPAIGQPPVAELWFSWTLAPGDTVAIGVSTPSATKQFTYNMPVGTVVDPGGFNHIGFTVGTTAGGVIGGGDGAGTALDRRLVAMECNPGSQSYGSLFAVAPGEATGIPIPAFTIQPTLPPAGTEVGQGVYVSSTRSAFVWDGTGWRDVAATPIQSFPTDADLTADVTEPIGTYAVSSSTGNMYVRVPSGWQRIGISEVSTYADLVAWNAALGTQAIVRDLDVLFLRVDDAVHHPRWIPISQLIKNEADIRATQNIAGLAAIALDTAKQFVNNGAEWVEQPIQHFPTDADLLASTPIDGHLAWADDTAQVYVAAGGAWKRLPGPNITVSDVMPTGAAKGDFWYKTLDKQQGLLVKGDDPTWIRPIPYLGDPANEGRTLEGDADGNLKWSTGSAVNCLSSAFTGVEQDYHTLPTPPKYWIESCGGVTGSSPGNTLLFFIMVDGSWYNFQPNPGMMLTVYGDGGKRIPDVSKDNFVKKGNNGLGITPYYTDYLIGPSSFASFRIRLNISPDNWVSYDTQITYTSDDGTPMTTTSAGLLAFGTADFIGKIERFGIKSVGVTPSMNGTQNITWM